MFAKGFTIVELLIVIVVISILASVTTVAFNGVQRRATNDTVLANLNSIEKFWRLYYAQNGDVFKLHPDDIQAASTQSAYITDPYYTRITERAGVCIGREWPKTVTDQGYEAMWDYCDSRPNNSGINRGLATELFDKAVKRSGDLMTSLPTMPSISPVDLWPNGVANPIKQRGIRLANLIENRKTYLMYPLNGKICFGSDRRVDFTATQWIDYYSSSGSDIPSASFDADFTQNDTVYCARTLAW